MKNVVNPKWSVSYIHYEWCDKLRVSDAQGERWRPGEVQVRFLRAVRARSGVLRGVVGPSSPALHGEGGLALTVDVRMSAVVLPWSGTHREVFGGSANFSTGRDGVAGAGGFVGNLTAQQIGETVAVWCRDSIHRAVSGPGSYRVGWWPAVKIDRRSPLWTVGPWSWSLGSHVFIHGTPSSPQNGVGWRFHPAKSSDLGIEVIPWSWTGVNRKHGAAHAAFERVCRAAGLGEVMMDEANCRGQTVASGSRASFSGGDNRPPLRHLLHTPPASFVLLRCPLLFLSGCSVTSSTSFSCVTLLR